MLIQDISIFNGMAIYADKVYISNPIDSTHVIHARVQDGKIIDNYGSLQFANPTSFVRKYCNKKHSLNGWDVCYCFVQSTNHQKKYTLRQYFEEIYLKKIWECEHRIKALEETLLQLQGKDEYQVIQNMKPIAKGTREDMMLIKGDCCRIVDVWESIHLPIINNLLKRFGIPTHTDYLFCVREIQSSTIKHRYYFLYKLHLYVSNLMTKKNEKVLDVFVV